MENLIFSLNATVPIFLLMVLGFILKKLGLIDDVFASKMNKFVFLVPLPGPPLRGSLQRGLRRGLESEVRTVLLRGDAHLYRARRGSFFFVEG